MNVNPASLLRCSLVQCSLVIFSVGPACSVLSQLMPVLWAFPSDSDSSLSAVGEFDLIPGLGRSPEEGNGNPFQYSCLENSMEQGVW